MLLDHSAAICDALKHYRSLQQQAAIMAAASAAGGGAYIGATPMAIATQIPPSALNGIGSPVVPSAQGKRFLSNRLKKNEKKIDSPSPS